MSRMEKPVGFIKGYLERDRIASDLCPVSPDNTCGVVGQPDADCQSYEGIVISIENAGAVYVRCAEWCQVEAVEWEDDTG